MPLSNYDGVDLYLLPPCKSSLKTHHMRVNYQTRTWKNAHVANPTISLTASHSWKLNDNNNFDIDWCDTDVIPQKLTEILSG